MSETESYSNPLPPTRDDYIDDDEENSSAHGPLTNDDFRKLLMTPRVSGGSAPQSTPVFAKPKIVETEDPNDPASLRKKKKSYYAQLKKEEEEREKELAQKYRDRATERRSGVSKDYDQPSEVSTTANYRAVAPDAKIGEDYAERRKQVIQESKYLGGDMEHTHLVKGLDYALLEKVKAEITSKEQEEEQMETIVTKPKPTEKVADDPEEQMNFKTKLGRNIFRAVFRNKPPERNELFLPGRMAYVVDLEDEYNDSDIPTTLIRSKADCPSLESTTTLTNNDIVINKLTQILSYLRQGRRDKKKKKDKAKLKEDDKGKMAVDEGIYGDFAVPAPVSKHDRDRSDRDKPRDHERVVQDNSRDNLDRGRDRGRDRHDRHADYERRENKKSYFEKPVEEEEEKGREVEKLSAKDFVRQVNDRFGKGNWGASDTLIQEGGEKVRTNKEDDRLKKLKSKTEIDSYAECYPGMMESADAIDDSDDEVDYTKMDQGNKKGPVGRWDFDTQEEYSDYMSNKEALPKAAFQYGVKMADGRKTRRAGPKDEKKELDREWQKIQNIIAKRKPGQPEDEPRSKQSKY